MYIYSNVKSIHNKDYSVVKTSRGLPAGNGAGVAFFVFQPQFTPINVIKH